jgi:phage gpG-like protein
MAVVDLDKGSKLIAALSRLLGTLEGPVEMWKAIGYAMEENTRVRFKDQVDIYGVRFIPSHRAQDQGGETLRDTGRLKSSIANFADKLGVEWGVPKEFPYAKILNEGGTIVPKTKTFLRFNVGSRWVSKRSVTIPARRYLGISREDKREILEIVRGFLVSGA